MIVRYPDLPRQPSERERPVDNISIEYVRYPDLPRQPSMSHPEFNKVWQSETSGGSMEVLTQHLPKEVSYGSCCHRFTPPASGPRPGCAHATALGPVSAPICGALGRPTRYSVGPDLC